MPENTTEKLWVTDEELLAQAEQRGIPAKFMRPALDRFTKERTSGFPAKDPLYGNRRYWPAVLEYWDLTHKRRA